MPEYTKDIQTGALVENIDRHKQCKVKKLYYHCEFNGNNNTCYWAPLGEGVRTYGEIYKCRKVVDGEAGQAR